MGITQVFKNIKNRVTRYYAEELILALIRLLHHPQANDIERIRFYQPWSILLLLKWTVMYGTFQLLRTKKPVTPQEVNGLLNRMNNLSEAVPRPSQYLNPVLFLRNLAFQQFWLQELYTRERFARQYLLFGDLHSNSKIARAFESVTRVSITDFLELSFSLFGRFLTQEELFVQPAWFSPIEAGYPDNTVTAFLDSISVDLRSARLWLQKLESEKDKRERLIEFEFYEQSPFSRYPLLKAGNGYICISPTLLQHSLNTFVYDVLREHAPHEFMLGFAPIFERYVAERLQMLQLPMLSEVALKRTLGDHAGQMYTDFLLISKDHNVFIEAKAVAMTWIGMVTNQAGTIRRQTKTSVLKGLRQAYALAHRLSHVNSIGGVTLGTAGSYLLIVTYKDLFIGTGEDFRHFIAPDEVDEIVSEYGEVQVIPLSNIYFISIDDLDLLVECVQSGKLRLDEILFSAVEADRDYGTKRFTFRQHVQSLWPELQTPAHLSQALDELLQSIKTKISQ